MTLSYPCIFYFDDRERSSAKYLAYFPDLDGMTQGNSKSDAISMAADYLKFRLADDLENKRKVAQPSEIGEISFTKNIPFQDDNTFEFNQEKSFILMISTLLK